jgi:predicted small metal-binding protein
MARKYIDCREHPDATSKCTLALSADSSNEVVEAAAQHAAVAHGLKDGPELRKQLHSLVKEGAPRA